VTSEQRYRHQLLPELDLDPATLAAQALGWLDPVTNAVTPPIHPATTYARDASYEKVDGRSYTRDDNPGYIQVEALIRELEGGADAMVLASGMAAATMPFLALAPGDHVVAPAIMYYGLRDWLNRVGRHWGLDVDFVAPGDVQAIANVLRPGKTKLVWIETPCNPTWDVTDIVAAAEVAHGVGAKLGVDSTVATPVLTRPLELGADLVMHSGTKYLNGHADVLAGALVTARKDAWWERIRFLRYQGGAVLGPFEAWLLLRGMRTLYLRVQRICQSALEIAQHFEGHPKLTAISYPGLKSHPGHAVAARQMRGGFGGMLALRLAGGEAAALRVVKAMRVFKTATSLGGVESLVEHRATVEGPDSPVPVDLLRLSVGIEAMADLVTDLEEALAAA